MVDDGSIEIIEFGQGFRDMSEPSKRLETLMMAGNLDHGGNPVLRWCIGNTMVEHDAAGNIKPSKKKSAEKIDGTIACVMAVGRAMEDEGESVYKHRGLLDLDDIPLPDDWDDDDE